MPAKDCCSGTSRVNEKNRRKTGKQSMAIAGHIQMTTRNIEELDGTGNLLLRGI